METVLDSHEVECGSNPNDSSSKPNLANPALTPLINLDATALSPGAVNPTAASPSPLNGERAGVRGEAVRLASPLEGRFIRGPGPAGIFAKTVNL